MKRIAFSWTIFALVFAIQGHTAAQSRPSVEVHATTTAELRAWDGYVSQHERDGQLRLRTTDRDPALPNRVIERFDQFHDGIRIWGADIVRDSERGVPQSLFGVLAPDLTLSVEPALDRAAAREAFLQMAGGVSMRTIPELVILPLDSGEYRLTYMAVVTTGSGVVRTFIDANTGAELLRYSEIHTQAAVGSGRGVLGDLKKLSVVQQAGAFFADDQLRPPVLTTFDMRGNLTRALGVVFSGGALLPSDRATDTDNSWTDVVAVDAHAYIGWTYDYFFKRHARRGLDDRNRPIVALINGVSQQGALSLPADLAVFAINAFWCGECGPGGVGVMYFGNGIPSGFVLASGQNVGYLAGSIDVIAHELTHGITDSSSRLISRNESGALNEAFSDMMGTSVEFFYQPPGSGLGQADYLIAEDTFRGVSTPLNGIRSMSNPSAFGDPDHYSRRFIGSDDSGGIHINAAIPNQAFYLAIEGGANRTSGLTVQGVGPANREQIERVFYRAFTLLLPSNATFSTARAATLQAARDLYGAGSAAERAVTQAWSAVGVFEQPTLTFSFSPSPAIGNTSSCQGLTPPCWAFRVTVQESSGLGFNVSSGLVGFFNDDQTLSSTSTFSFSSLFTSCGPGSTRIPPRGTACANLIVSRGGRPSGYIAFALSGSDDNGASLTFSSSLLRLAPSTGSLAPTSSVADPESEQVHRSVDAP